MTDREAIANIRLRARLARALDSLAEEGDDPWVRQTVRPKDYRYVGHDGRPRP